MVYSCVLLAEKKISKEQKQEKKIRQKIKEKIVKENRRYRKGAHKEHSIALLFVVPFALFISVATFNTCFLSSLFPLLFITTGDRNTYRPATRTSALDIYSILLSVTDLCAIYIYLFFFRASQAPHILQIGTEKDPCNLSVNRIVTRLITRGDVVLRLQGLGLCDLKPDRCVALRTNRCLSST